MKNVINLYGLRNSEFLGYGNDLITLISAADPGALGLSPAFDPFVAEWNKLSDYFALEQGSLLSNTVEALDKRRDRAVVGIRLIADGYTKHFDEARVAAGEQILATMDKYGKSIQSQNLLAQTETVRNLVEDFEEMVPVKEALTLLGLTDFALELKNANNEFNQVYLERNAETSQKPDASFVALRKPATEVYRKLVRRIESREELDGTPELTKLINEIDELISKYNLLIANRKAGNEAPASS